MSVAFALNGLSTNIGTRGKFSGANQFVQHINNLLRASDGKRGDDNFAVLLERFADVFVDQIVRVRPLLVNARGVSGFDLEIIHVLDGNRIAQQFIAAAPDVAGEQPAEFFAVFLKCPKSPAPNQECVRRLGM